MAHHDRSHFGGRPSLSGHNGHGWSGEGYVEGQNIRFEFRLAKGQLNRLPELAAELVGLKVDVIVAWFTPAALAAKQATREIPIVIKQLAGGCARPLICFADLSE